MRVFHLNVRESKIVSDSRFHAIDTRFHALNSSLCWWDLDSGLQSLVRFQIPKSMILDSTGKIFPDSGFHAQNFSDSGFHEQNFSESGIRIPLHGAICSWGNTKGLGTAEPVEPADATQQGYSPSPPMAAQVDLQHFTPNDVHTDDIRPGVHCRLRNGVIGFCVESSIEKVDLPLSWRFHRLIYFQNCELKKSVKSHKPVRKTYTDLKMLFPSIERLVFLFPSPLTLFKIRS